MGLSQRLRLFLCYYMLLERANKRKLPQKISPDGSYQRHLHRQIKWAISLKTICMFQACYESALCQANSLPECSKYYEKKRPYFSSLVHAALIKSMSIHAHVYSHVRCVSLHVFLFVFCVFSSSKKDITLIHIWGHLSHHFLFLWKGYASNKHNFNYSRLLGGTEFSVSLLACQACLYNGWWTLTTAGCTVVKASLIKKKETEATWRPWQRRTMSRHDFTATHWVCL